jgi:tetratricopeptide (TPR) repeat protein
LVRASIRWGAVAALAIACGSSGPRPTAPPTTPEIDLVAELEADPEPALAPAWLRGALFPNGYDRDSLIALVEGDDNLGALPGAVVAASIERDLAAGQTCEPRCLRALFYGYLTVRRHAVFGRDMLIAAIVGLDPLSEIEPAKKAEVEAYARALIERTPGRSRALAARLLRANPTSSDTTRALAALARVEQLAGERRLAAALAARSVAAASPPAEALVNAAEICFQTGDLSCGDGARARAEKAGAAAADADRWAELAELRAAAHRIAALGIPTRDAGRRELVGLLVDVGRDPEALTLYRELARAHPRDARLATSLARLLRTDTGSNAAAEVILGAGPDHRDAAFYRVAAGVLAHHLVRELGTGDRDALRTLAPGLRALLRGLAAHEPDRAEILEIALDLLLELTAPGSTASVDHWAHTEALQRAIGRVDAARQRRPDSEHLARLALFLSVPDKDEARERKAVAEIAARFADREPMAELIRDATVLLGPEGLTRAIAGLGAIAAPTDAQRLALLDLTAANTPDVDADAWTAIAASYGQILSASSGPDPRTVSNYATALYRIGSKDEARAVWLKAIELGADHPAPGINLYASGEKDREQLWAWIEAKLESRSGDTGILARRWHIRVTAASDEERRARLEALDKEPRIGFAEGLDGVVFSVSYELGIGYSTREDLLINADLDVDPWLVLD